MNANEKVKEMSAKRRADKEAFRAAMCSRLYPIIGRMINNPIEYDGAMINYGIDSDDQRLDKFWISDCPEVENLIQSVNLNNPNIKFSYNPKEPVNNCHSVLHEENDKIVHNLYKRSEYIDDYGDCMIQ